MILSYFLLLLFITYINANEQYQIGIINHDTQWYIHCLENDTRIINPPLNDQALIPYQCPYPSLSTDILPIEIDFTFVCRLQSRLIWILIDLYQYDVGLWTINPEQVNISLIINQQIQIKDYKNEINKYRNRFIIINAFYAPFESLEILANKYIEVFVQINQCRFYLHENSTWNDVLHKNCNLIESKTLTVQYAQCDFFPKLKHIDTNRDLEEELYDDNNTTMIPDFHVILSIDQQKPIETTTTTTHFYDYHLLLDEHYRKVLSILTIIRNTANLITYIFIFTTIILILLVIFFVYVLCYDSRIRTIRRSSLLI